MGQFFKFVFASCLGTILASIAVTLLFGTMIAGLASKGMKAGKMVTINDNSVLKINIPAVLPEQSDNIAVGSISFKHDKVLGVHDYAKTIRAAKTDPKIKGIYINTSNINQGFASLKIIRDAILDFKSGGKFVIAFGNYFDNKNYYISSTADQIYLNPMGSMVLKGFEISIPFFTELMDKIGLNFNIYYAGEFKSATEPFRLKKMSPENRLQLSEYINSAYDLFLDQISKSRSIPKVNLKNDFDLYLSSSPVKAYNNHLVDSIASEVDALNNIRIKINAKDVEDIHFVTPEKYFDAMDDKTDYTSKNRIAVVYAEGDIIDGKGEEGQIGKKYVKLLRELRNNSNIKALVLRINSGGGSALMSDDIMREIDLIKSSGKPVVASMGDVAASGGYYIACHADSIFASPHTITGSIGVFSMIPNLNKMTDVKIGVDFDSIGTGPMATKFNVMFPWGPDEAKVMQENVDNVYDTFLSVVSKGRNMSKDDVDKIARGRIWPGNKAKELGLISQIGELEDAVKCAAGLASLQNYRTSEYPTQKDPIQKIFDKIKNEEEDVEASIKENLLKQALGKYYSNYKDWQKIQEMQGIQMRMPYELRID